MLCGPWPALPVHLVPSPARVFTCSTRGIHAVHCPVSVIRRHPLAMRLVHTTDADLTVSLFLSVSKSCSNQCPLCLPKPILNDPFFLLILGVDLRTTDSIYHYLVFSLGNGYKSEKTSFRFLITQMDTQRTWKAFVRFTAIPPLCLMWCINTSHQRPQGQRLKITWPLFMKWTSSIRREHFVSGHSHQTEGSSFNFLLTQWLENKYRMLYQDFGLSPSCESAKMSETKVKDHWPPDKQKI